MFQSNDHAYIVTDTGHADSTYKDKSLKPPPPAILTRDAAPAELQ